MANTHHRKVLTEGVEAWNRWREENPHIQPDFSQRVNRVATLTDLSLTGINLRDADLSGARLENLNLAESDLRGASLHSARLRNVNLDGADLSEADLRHSSLFGVSLRSSRLVRANFFRASLGYGSKFHEADCADAKFEDAVMYNDGESPGGIEGLSQQQVDSSSGNLATALPPGLVKPRHWLLPSRSR